MKATVLVSDVETDSKKPTIQIPMITLENRIIDFGAVMNEVIQQVRVVQPKLKFFHHLRLGSPFLLFTRHFNNDSCVILTLALTPMP